MAIYRIFPDSDAFIFTEDIKANAGRDEIIELGGYPIAGTGQTSRLLLKFRTADIQNTVNNIIGDNVFSSSLHLYLASAYELPETYSLEAYPVYNDWTNGVGKFDDDPVDKSGVSWRFTKGETDGTKWTLPTNTPLGSIPAGVTGSYNTTYQGGGGAWYTGSAGVDLQATKTYSLTADHDLDINITNAVTMHYSESLSNNGYIVKLSDDLEFNTTSSIRLKYYSADTNTIYPPYLEFSWDDSIYQTGSLSVLNNSECSITVTNNRGKYSDTGKQRFRLHARPNYPTRTFTTASAYTTNYALPTASYWGIRDEYTEEMIIPFNTGSTKISCDSTGPYFDLHLDSFQPERFYRVLIKSEIDGTNTVFDNNITFKVVRNG